MRFPWSHAGPARGTSARLRPTRLVALAGCLVLAPLLAAMASASTTSVAPSPDDAAARARLIQRTYFGSIRVTAIREAGYDAIRRVQDPQVLLELARVLQDERDDARAVLVDHLAASGDAGQAILAWLSITAPDPRLRGAAARVLQVPAHPAAADVIRAGLVRGTAIQIDRAAELAAWLEATDLLPDLVARLSTSRIVQVDFGRRADILSLTSVFLPSNILAPETIPGGLGFGPGVTRSGIGLGRGYGEPSYRRIESPRPVVHRSLLALARLEHGPTVPDLGVDRDAWFDWLARVTPMGPPRP